MSRSPRLPIALAVSAGLHVLVSGVLFAPRHGSHRRPAVIPIGLVPGGGGGRSTTPAGPVPPPEIARREVPQEPTPAAAPKRPAAARVVSRRPAPPPQRSSGGGAVGGGGEGPGSGGGTGAGSGQDAGPGSGAARVAYGQNPAPPYPLAARRLGLEGVVELRVRVAPDGRPDDVRVVSSSGHPLLDASAVDTVRTRWRFVPAERDGVPVADHVRFPIRFRLAGTGTPG